MTTARRIDLTAASNLGSGYASWSVFRSSWFIVAQTEIVVALVWLGEVDPVLRGRRPRFAFELACDATAPEGDWMLCEKVRKLAFGGMIRRF